jgi:hypothetical protein
MDVRLRRKVSVEKEIHRKMRLRYKEIFPEGESHVSKSIRSGPPTQYATGFTDLCASRCPGPAGQSCGRLSRMRIQPNLVT